MAVPVQPKIPVSDANIGVSAATELWLRDFSPVVIELIPKLMIPKMCLLRCTGAIPLLLIFLSVLCSSWH